MKYRISRCVTAVFILFFIYSCGRSGNFNIEGIVKSKERGIDGYTAYILGDDGKNYSAVISTVNMDFTFEYQELLVGDHVKVYGDSINLGNEVSITVTKIRKK
jgi:hypothetical protein